MIQNLIFGVCLLILDFLVESLKAKKTSKKDDSFYNTVSFKKSQLTQHCQKYTPVTPKTLLTLVKNFSRVVPENTFALHHFQTSQECK